MPMTSRTSIAWKVRPHPQVPALAVQKVDVTIAAAIAIVVGAAVGVAVEADAVPAAAAEAVDITVAAVDADGGKSSHFVCHSCLKNQGSQRMRPFFFCLSRQSMTVDQNANDPRMMASPKRQKE